MADNTESSIQQLGIPEISMDLSVSQVTTQPTDPTLRNSGQPADAKAVGDRFSETDESIADLGADVAEISSALASLATRVFVESLFPVGSVYATSGSGVPADMPGTWEEIKLPLKWGDANSGDRSYVSGTGAGNLHFWMRTA